MKKLIFITILTLLSSMALAQSDSTVILPKKVALFYMERHELAKTQTVLLDKNDSIMFSYEKTIIDFSSLVEVYRQDSTALSKMIEAREIEADLYKESEEFYKDEMKKIRRQRNLSVIIGGAIIVLLLL